MTVTKVDRDTDALTLTIASQFDAPVERIWQLWEDPRQLERWWGPPTYPATFTQHEFSPNGDVRYHMTSPEGEKHHGWWRVLAVDPPARLQIEEGFADADGNPSDVMPAAIMTVTFTEALGRTTMSIETKFPSAEAMDQVLDMGMEEGMTLALGQIDELLAEDEPES